MKLEEFLKLVYVFPLESDDPAFNGKKVLYVDDFLDVLNRNKLSIS